MSPVRLRLLVPLLVASGAILSGCGQDSIKLAKDDPNFRGAQIFYQRCAGCHTLNTSSSEGSATDVNSREYKDGPNFNTRQETRSQVLYAIRNGGFSSGPMPQNIVVGKEAEQVADFVAKYSGNEAKRSPNPGNAAPAGGPPGDTSE